MGSYHVSTYTNWWFVHIHLGNHRRWWEISNAIKLKHHDSIFPLTFYRDLGKWKNDGGLEENKEGKKMTSLHWYPSSSLLHFKEQNSLCFILFQPLVQWLPKCQILTFHSEITISYRFSSSSLHPLQSICFPTSLKLLVPHSCTPIRIFLASLPSSLNLELWITSRWAPSSPHYLVPHTLHLIHLLGLASWVGGPVQSHRATHSEGGPQLEVYFPPFTTLKLLIILPLHLCLETCPMGQWSMFQELGDCSCMDPPLLPGINSYQSVPQFLPNKHRHLLRLIRDEEGRGSAHAPCTASMGWGSVGLFPYSPTGVLEEPEGAWWH